MTLEGRTKFIKGYLFATPLLVVLAIAVIFPAVHNLGIAFGMFAAFSVIRFRLGVRRIAKFCQAVGIGLFLEFL